MMLGEPINNSNDEMSSKTGFWLFFAPEGQADRHVLSVVNALYYLPMEFKLLFAGTRSHIPPSWQEDFGDRVKYQGEVGQGAPFSIPNAIIYSENPDPTKSAPAIIVTHQTKTDLVFKEPHQFTVAADKPEAIASAALRLAYALA